VAGDQDDVALLRDGRLGQQLHAAAVGQHEIDEHQVGYGLEVLARFGKARC
jgi:hypothetical protein